MTTLTSFLGNAFINFRLADLFDIAIISTILYFILIWIRRRASRSAVIALVSVLLLYTCARVFDMYLTSMLFQAGLTASLVALVLIFQEDLRMAIEQLSSWGAYRSKHALVASSKTIESLVESSVNLARDRIGALVVLKGRDSLDRHLSGGISLGGRLSMPLLYSIFHPATPSHDGAVIVEADRIEHFGVRLPLSHNSSEVGNAGTRHTAGLGLSERSDALIVIVSEERGVISIAENGHLDLVSPEQLRERLEKFYRTIFPEPEKGKPFAGVTRNLSIKLAAAGIAVLLWTFLAFRIETVNRTFTIPVECRNIPQYCIVENPRPMQVLVSVSGVERAFSFDPASLVVSLDMEKTVDGIQTVPIDKSNINLPDGIKIQQISPRSISISSQRFCPVDLPIKIRFDGTLKPGMSIAASRMQPSTVRLLVPERKKARINEIPTEPLDMGQISDNATSFRLKLAPPYGTRLLNENDTEVRAYISIEKRSDTTRPNYNK